MKRSLSFLVLLPTLLFGAVAPNSLQFQQWNSSGTALAPARVIAPASGGAFSDLPGYRTAIGMGTGDSPTFASVTSTGGTITLAGGASVTSTGGNITYAPSASGFNYSARPYFVGGTSTNSVDSWFTTNRTINTSANSHAFSASDNIAYTENGWAYAPFDARFTVTGSANYDHFASFQAAPVIGTSGLTTLMYGTFSSGLLNTGSVTAWYHHMVENVTGTGTLAQQYGLRVKQLTKGATNYAIYVENNNSYFNGQIQVGVNTPAYISAPSDGAMSITLAGTNKDFNVTPSGTGAVKLNGPTQVLGGFTYNDRTDASTIPNYVMNSSGSNYGQIYSLTSTSFALGYGAAQATKGTAAVAWDTSNNVVSGPASAIATNATDGFFYVPTCAGTPTGTPTSKTGKVPIVVDTSNNKLYFYSGGAWRDAGP